MTFAYLGNGVYTLNNGIYIINTENDFFIIDTTEDIGNSEIMDILEITKGKRPRYIILTSCCKSVSGGAWYIYQTLGIKIIAHYPDSISIRHGECNNLSYTPVNVSLELKGYVNCIDNIKIINSKVPTNGSIIVKWKNFLFVGNNKTLSPYGNEVKYVCGINGCIKVQ
ncbi:MBL fold metallo-hydrolase [Acidianus sp. HS-5]|uniref:MBL fold metallo-hydrolase n=1 Tax=Acidianus sp. HS-5 TaxID=2886040 RepID=UPI001F17CB1E|nr:MBL fold metallo-hydrolase [Acidianus sp. HS-5]BDC19242.1 hypothetical protein HS5_21320 [Acidianus sp. HS-5]